MHILEGLNALSGFILGAGPSSDLFAVLDVIFVF